MSLFLRDSDSFVSILGIINILTIIIFLSFYVKNITFKNHIYAKFLLIQFVLYMPSFVINFDISNSIRILSTFGSLIAIYFISIPYVNSKNFEQLFIKYLKLHFIFFSLIGCLHAFNTGFVYNEGDVRNILNSFIYENPHALGIYTASILPFLLFYIKDKKVIKLYYIFVFLMFISFYYSGAKIAFVIYFLSFFFFFTYNSIIKIKFQSFVIFFAIIISLYSFLPSTKLTQDITSVISSEKIDSYIDNYDKSYKTNSFDYRVGTWYYMYVQLVNKDKLFEGLGWRAWDKVYANKIYAGNSSQSDYFTILFEVGLIGFIGLLIFKFKTIVYFYKIKGDYSSVFVVAAIVLYIGSFTENVDFYASTSWLIPVYFAIFHKYKNKATFI